MFAYASNTTFMLSKKGSTSLVKSSNTVLIEMFLQELKNYMIEYELWNTDDMYMQIA